MYLQFLQAFVLLLVIIDPLASLAAFMTLTGGMKQKEQDSIAKKAVLVAAMPFFLFVFFSGILEDLLRLDLETFKAAAGLIFILLGIQLSLGVNIIPVVSEKQKDKAAIAAIIATPFITGPATISAAVILSHDMGMAITAAAGLAALTVCWVALRLGSSIYGYLGPTGLRVLSTMMGLITIAWGMAFIKEGLFGA